MREPDDAVFEQTLARLSPARWDEIAAALDDVEAAVAYTDGWSPTEPTFPGDTRHFPFPLYTRRVGALIRTLGEDDLTVSFDWMNWPGFREAWPAERFVQGTIVDAHRLVITAIRGERFSDGFIEALLARGVLQAAVRRLLDARPTPN